MTNITKIPIQLDAQQIGVLLGCVDAVIQMGYGGGNQMLMQEVITEVERQVHEYTIWANTTY